MPHETINAVIIAFDDTRYCQSNLVRELRSVFLLDRNEHVHACELTPSYRCIHLYTDVVCDLELSDEERESLQEKYGSEPQDDRYVHAGDVERIIASGRNVYLVGEAEIDHDLSHDEQMEQLREHYAANHHL